MGVIEVRLPSETKSGFVDIKRLDEEGGRAAVLAETIVRAHGLTPLNPAMPYQQSPTPVVALQAMVHPATMRDDRAYTRKSSWVFLYEKPHDVPDRLSCYIVPPRIGNVLQITLMLEYAGPASPMATALYGDLIQQMTARYGADRTSATKF